MEAVCHLTAAFNDADDLRAARPRKCQALEHERAGSIPISSNKSMIGHTLTAAGAVEAIFTLLALQHGRLPPTINYAMPDPALPVDCVPNVARDSQVAHAISNSFGFGGQNVCLVLGAP